MAIQYSCLLSFFCVYLSIDIYGKYNFMYTVGFRGLVIANAMIVVSILTGKMIYSFLRSGFYQTKRSL